MVAQSKQVVGQSTAFVSVPTQSLVKVTFTGHFADFVVVENASLEEKKIERNRSQKTIVKSNRIGGRSRAPLTIEISRNLLLIGMIQIRVREWVLAVH